MSLTFFYSVLLLFPIFNPSKHHLHLIRFPFLVSFFKYVFLSCFYFLSFRPNTVEFCILTNMLCDDHPTMSFFVTITQTAFIFLVPERPCTLYLFFSMLYSPYNTGHSNKFLFSQFSVIWVNFFIYWGGGRGRGCRWAPGGLVFRKA